MTNRINLEIKNHIKNKEELNELIRKAQNGCEISKELAIETNLRLVLNIAHKFKGKESMLDDLFQVGTIGLIKSLERFEIEKGYHFSTYASYLIYGEMKKYLRDYNPVKISRNIKENGYKIKKFINEYYNEFYKEPTVKEISNKLKLNEKEVIVAFESLNEIEYLSKMKTDNNGQETKSVEDKIKAENSQIDKWIEKENLKQAFDILNEKEKEIIILRYFEEKTQQEIGIEFGISQAHISRLERNALKKMKEVI